MAHHRIEGDDLGEAGYFQLLMHGIFAGYEPSVLKVIDKMIRSGILEGKGRPLFKSIRDALFFLPRGEVVSSKRAKEFIDSISTSGRLEIAVGPCVCQEALGARHGIHMKDMAVLYGADLYQSAKPGYKNMSSDEIKSLFDDLDKEGCMPVFFACMNSKGWMVVICNCDGEICIPVRVHRIMGGILSPGPDIIELDAGKCTSCGRCIRRCHFGANSIIDGSLKTDLDRCYGCGNCASACPKGARRLKARKNYLNRYYPIDFVNHFKDRTAHETNNIQHITSPDAQR